MKSIAVLFLIPTMMLSGCATFSVQCTAHGVGGGPASPYAYALLPFAIVFDVATSPFQFFYFAGMQ